MRGIVSAGGSAFLAGVLPTPAVALLAEDLQAVISASHNPPEYNGVKLFDGEGRKLVDEDEEAIEALLDAPSVNGGSVEHVAGARERYLAHVLEGSAPTSPGCASASIPRTALSRTSHPPPSSSSARGACDRLGAGRDEHQRRLWRDRPPRPAGGRPGAVLDLGVAFDGDGDRMLAVDERGEPLDGDQILAILALPSASTSSP